MFTVFVVTRSKIGLLVLFVNNILNWEKTILHGPQENKCGISVRWKIQLGWLKGMGRELLREDLPEFEDYVMALNGCFYKCKHPTQEESWH